MLATFTPIHPRYESTYATVGAHCDKLIIMGFSPVISVSRDPPPLRQPDNEMSFS